MGDQGHALTAQGHRGAVSQRTTARPRGGVRKEGWLWGQDIRTGRDDPMGEETRRPTRAVGEALKDLVGRGAQEMLRRALEEKAWPCWAGVGTSGIRRFGAIAGGRHEVMVRGTTKVPIPKPHQGDVGPSCWPGFSRKPVSPARTGRRSEVRGVESAGG